MDWAFWLFVVPLGIGFWAIVLIPVVIAISLLIMAIFY